MKFKLTFACILFLFTACTTTKYTYKPFSSVLDTWIGFTENDLVKRVGPPSSVTSDGNGGKILSYNSLSSYTYGQLVPSYIKGVSPTYESSTNYANSYFQIYVDNNSKIYHYRTNYAPVIEKVEKKKSPGKTIALIAALGLTIFVIIGVANGANSL